METQRYLKHYFLPGWITPRYEFLKSWEGGWVIQTSFWSMIWKIWKFQARWFSFSSILLLLLFKQIPQPQLLIFSQTSGLPSKTFSAVFFFPWIFTPHLHSFFCSVFFTPSSHQMPEKKFCSDIFACSLITRKARANISCKGLGKQIKSKLATVSRYQ